MVPTVCGVFDGLTFFGFGCRVLAEAWVVVWPVVVVLVVVPVVEVVPVVVVTVHAPSVSPCARCAGTAGAAMLIVCCGLLIEPV
ncbi:MAG TPA: hypothetical protein VIU81_10525 [Gaiellaceae bacterium]